MNSQNFEINQLMKKIELGSAQFGLDYGVNNGKKVTYDESMAIHNVLYDNGSCLIDTAPSYGDSEFVVSRIMKNNTKIISKLLPLSKYNTNEIIQGIESTKELFGDNLFGLMIHHSDDVYHQDFTAVIKHLNKIRSPKLKIGVSVYDPLDAIDISKKIPIDLIQIPFNILDQRANMHDFQEFLKNNSIDVHVRSVFLQGLLLMGDHIPVSLKSIKPYCTAVKIMAQSHGLSVYEFCLLYVINQDWVDHMVIGLDSHDQANTLVSTIHKLSHVKEKYDVSTLACNDINLINPAKWVS